MSTALIVILSIVLYLVAYNTYGKFLARKVFKIDETSVCPSEEFKDDNDYVPTKKSILFGHHFTSIAGLGPLVGPAIAVIWGWVPALLWVLIGSIVMGAVHDFGALVISLRHKGRSIGDICSGLINKRVRFLFLAIMFFVLLVTISIFAYIIAAMFIMFPQTIVPVVVLIPLAIIMGLILKHHNVNLIVLTSLFIVLIYGVIIAFSSSIIKMPELFNIEPLKMWTILILLYAFIASILPVQLLLQPRDYLNAYQLFISLILLSVAIIIVNPIIVAPALSLNPKGAPDIMPMLFVIVACGAISGFHALVSSGTSSKQCDNEKNALFISYGSMLLEGFLAILTIIACTAGLGLGVKINNINYYGIDAFNNYYISWNAANGLASKLNAFVNGASNILEMINIPEVIAIALISILVVSFAATSIDTATRIQRYTITEFFRALGIEKLSNKYIATSLAVLTALILAFWNGSGKGALLLWPLFGALNQMIAALALLIVTVYLAYKKAPTIYTSIPMIFMFIITSWAMIININDFLNSSNWLLLGISLIVCVIEIWMIIESVLILKKAYTK